MPRSMQSPTKPRKAPGDRLAAWAAEIPRRKDPRREIWDYAFRNTYASSTATKSHDSNCPECKGTGERDSGGTAILQHSPSVGL